MSNLTSFILASFFLILSIWGFYFLIKKWPKFHITIFGKTLKAVYALMLLLAISISSLVAYEGFGSYWEDDRVRVVTELQGVKLGWSKDEVYFRKGEPTSVDIKNDKETYLDYGAIGVILGNGKVVKVIYVCNDDRYEKIGGISCDSEVDRIVKQYGESKALAISADKLSRIYNYPKYNLAFLLSKSKVETLAIFDSTKVPNGFSFRYAWEDAPIVPNADAGKFDESQVEWELVKPANKKTYSIEEVMEATQDDAKEIQKLSRGEELALELYGESALDHCAPDLKKAERLRRLALKGMVRETGYQTYSTGSHEIVFSAGNLYRCR